MYYNTVHYWSITNPPTQCKSSHTWMLENRTQTIVQVHSQSAVKSKEKKEAGGRTKGSRGLCETLGYDKRADGWEKQEEAVCNELWRLVFRGPPCPCHLLGGSLTCRSYHPAGLALVTGLWMSALGPWMTWVMTPYKMFREVIRESRKQEWVVRES